MKLTKRPPFKGRRAFARKRPTCFGVAGIGAALILASPAAITAKTSGGRVDGEVRRAHTAWFDALLSEDVAALDRLLAADVTLMFGGHPMARNQFLSHLRAGELFYDTADHKQSTVRVLGTTGVVTGRSDLRYRFKAEAGFERLSYTAVYAVTHGRWWLLAWHSTMLPQE